MAPDIKTMLDRSMGNGLYPKMVRQVNKDFRRAGMKAELPENASPDSLCRNLIAIVYELIVSDFAAYLNLLYTVDIPENHIKSLPEQRVDELASDVGAMILRRELQKVRNRENK